MLAPLVEEGIGDPASRDLFAAALEYDLAGWRRIVDNEPKPARPKIRAAGENTIAELATAAHALAEQIDQLDDGARRQLLHDMEGSDRFNRSYGEDYLSALGCELLRVAEAAETPRHQAETSLAKPAVSDAAREFVARAAHAFGECFEITATAESGAPFLTAIRAIVAATEIEVPTDQRTVSLILAQA